MNQKEWLEYFETVNGRKPSAQEFAAAKAAGEFSMADSQPVQSEIPVSQLTETSEVPVSQSTPAQIFCPKCGKEVKAGAAFCNNCGQNLSAVSQQPAAPAAPQKAFCPHCGKEVPAGTAFCPHCGQSISATANAAAALNVGRDKVVAVAGNASKKFDEFAQKNPGLKLGGLKLIDIVSMFGALLVLLGTFVFNFIKVSTGNSLVDGVIGDKLTSTLAGLGGKISTLGSTFGQSNNSDLQAATGGLMFLVILFLAGAVLAVVSAFVKKRVIKIIGLAVTAIALIALLWMKSQVTAALKQIGTSEINLSQLHIYSTGNVVLILGALIVLVALAVGIFQKTKDKQ